MKIYSDFRSNILRFVSIVQLNQFDNRQLIMAEWCHTTWRFCVPIGWGNGASLLWRQAITGTNCDFCQLGPKANISMIWMETQMPSGKERHLKNEDKLVPASIYQGADVLLLSLPASLLLANVLTVCGYGCIAELPDYQFYTCKIPLVLLLGIYFRRSEDIVLSNRRDLAMHGQDDIIKLKHFPRYWPFVRGIHRSRVNSRTKASDAELWCFLWSASE